MTIDEAIKGLKSRLTPKGVIQFGDPDADIQLGIEALKRVKELRLRYNLGIPYYLPGERQRVSILGDYDKEVIHNEE